MKKNLKSEAIETSDDMYESVKVLRSPKREELISLLLKIPVKEELAARYWRKEIRDTLGLDISATIFVQDPMVADFNPNLGAQKMSVKWEHGLFDGPTSSRIAVVDYDGDLDKVYPPAIWDKDNWTYVGSDGQPLAKQKKNDFQFHQVNVWATIMKVLEFYEAPDALGRSVPWAFNGNRLIVIPHAGFGRNAFYDRRSKSLQFYYFGSQGKTVFTCLSHDIIAHETGHAILDGIRPYYNELSSFESAAFHEFVADLTAILTAMRNNDVRKVLKEATEGDLTKDKFLSSVAEEFGKHVVNRPFLRTARNKILMKHISIEKPPHFNSQVLTGAMFDIMTQMAANYMEKREKKAGAALWYTINRFGRVALQALDYCPPVDIRFKDYANAVLRRDQLANPDDPQGYRKVMKNVFRGRGILNPTAEEEPDYSDFFCHDITKISTSATAVYHFLHKMREELFIPAHQDIFIMTPYRADKVRRLYQRRPTEIILQYIWRENVELKGSRFGSFQGKNVPLICGGTLVYDENGNLLHWCRKPGTQFRTGKKTKKASEKEKKEKEMGMERQNDLLNYVEECISNKTLRLRTGERGAMDIWSPFDARQTDEGFRLEIAPRLHQGDEIKGESNGK